ncbi:MAG: RNA polymerase sigma-70 factor [Tannerella sp.]|jgi:RNA polymerase sigma-70 factor (ECF subfamily)|nr:RNA polymerase sigma-70 factor [Tannerella sp.]
MEKSLETACLKKLAKGDHRSYEILFLYYHPRIHHFLCGFIKNDEEAFDMTQDIFYKVWENRLSMGEVTSFKAYLFTMARHMIYNNYEHNLVKEKYTISQLQLEEEYNPEEEFFAKELSLLIDLVIEQMPEQRRRIFKLSREKGLSGDEIATRLNISKRTVENQISNALKDLRKALQCFIIFFFL